MKPVVLFTREMPDDERELIRTSGFDVIEKPLIKIIPEPADTVWNQVRNISMPDAMVVTSKNGSKALIQVLNYSGDFSKTIPIYALGKKTALPLEENNIPYINCDATTGGETARFIAEHIDKKNAVIWHFCGNRSRKETKEELKNAGFTYVPLISYTTQNRETENLDSLNVSAIVFYSPSAVQSYCEQVNKINMDVPVFTLGPTTLTEAIEAGFTKVYEADEPSIFGLINQLKDYFKL